MNVLHVSPHPDDELLGAPAALVALRDGGARVVNYAVGLGRPGDRARRLGELRTACARAGFELVVADPPHGISRDDDLGAAEERLAAEVAGLVQEGAVDLVVSPSPHDRHHGHEVVGRAVREALRARGDGPAWWMWGLWASLPLPTLYVPFGAAELERIRHALAAHSGEVRRNDLLDLLEARARTNAVLGAELVFGFGSAGPGARYADLLTEVRRDGGAWRLGAARTLDPDAPLGHVGTPGPRVDGWLDAPGVSELLRGDAGPDPPG